VVFEEQAQVSLDLFYKCVCALNGEHALRIQLVGGYVNIPKTHRHWRFRGRNRQYKNEGNV